MRLISGRVIVAAAKLALFYAIAVIVEIVILGFARRSGVPTLDVIGGIALHLGTPVAAGFVLLVLARRWGFIALWLVLVALWVHLGRFAGMWSLYPTLFLSWSFFALPLWVMGQVGTPSRAPALVQIGPVRVSTSAALLVSWAALAVASLLPALIDVLFSYRFANLSRRVWFAAPFVLSAYAMWHVWRGTSLPLAARAQPVALD